MREADAVAADAGNQAAERPVDWQVGQQVGAGGWRRGRRRRQRGRMRALPKPKPASASAPAAAAGGPTRDGGGEQGAVRIEREERREKREERREKSERGREGKGKREDRRCKAEVFQFQKKKTWFHHQSADGSPRCPGAAVRPNPPLPRSPRASDGSSPDSRGLAGARRRRSS